MKEIYNAILTLGSTGKVELAMRKGKSLIQLYDKHRISSWLYQRTYNSSRKLPKRPLYLLPILKTKLWPTIGGVQLHSTRKKTTYIM